MGSFFLFVLALAKPQVFFPLLIGALGVGAFVADQRWLLAICVLALPLLIVPGRESWPMQVWGPVRAAGAEGWGWALAAFGGLYTLLFTTFLTHPDGIKGLWTGLDYWLGQHDVARGGEPAVFYTAVLITIEWPVLLLGAIGAVSLWRRKPLFAAFLIWDFIVSMIVYSWAGEKFAWLVLHPLLPAVLLAGAGIQAIWQARGTVWRPIGIAARGDRAVLQRRLLVVGERGPRRQPARDARLHPVRGRRSSRSPTRCSRWPPAAARASRR